LTTKKGEGQGSRRRAMVVRGSIKLGKEAGRKATYKGCGGK